MIELKLKNRKGSFHVNSKEVKDIIKVAKLNHADLIVFPEMTLTGFTMKCKEMYDESIDDFFKELSQKYFIKI